VGGEFLRMTPSAVIQCTLSAVTFPGVVMGHTKSIRAANSREREPSPRIMDLGVASVSEKAEKSNKVGDSFVRFLN